MDRELSQDVHLDFHTVPEFCSLMLLYVHRVTLRTFMDGESRPRRRTATTTFTQLLSSEIVNAM